MKIIKNLATKKVYEFDDQADNIELCESAITDGEIFGGSVFLAIIALACFLAF